VSNHYFRKEQVSELTTPSRRYHDSDDEVTLRTAARMLGVTTQTPRLWIKTGKLTTGRLAETGYYRVSRAEVESIIAERAAAHEARKDRRRAARLAAVARKAA
jgi:hypothetical protein